MVKKSDFLKEIEVDYKNIHLLKKFISERGKIIQRRLAGVSSKKQRQIALAVKRARFLALLPYVADNQ